MISIIEDNKGAIVALCREYQIKRLDLFGSAATGEFNPETSDVDCIVDLGAYEPGMARRYFGFAEELERLLGRPVDLITPAQINNPYLQLSVEEQRINVFADPDVQAAA